MGLIYLSCPGSSLGLGSENRVLEVNLEVLEKEIDELVVMYMGWLRLVESVVNVMPFYET